MNLHEVAGSLDDKSIEILQLLVGQERHLNPGLRGTLTTPTVKRECGWTNQTVLRRFRKLEEAGLVRLSDVDSTWPEYDRYPRPPKAIERAFDVDTSDIREVINHWDGRDARSPAQLTDDLDDLRHRIGATDDRLTNRIDTLQSKQYAHLRQHALADRRRARRRKRALAVAVGTVVAYLLVLVAVVLLAPELLASVLIGGVSAALGVAIGIGVSAYALPE
jgi:uncharacterized membrane protein (DUF485 family)